MKQCPNCKTTYTDETLRFCLADGTTLISLNESEPTVAFNRQNQVRVDIQKDSAPESVATLFSPAVIPPAFPPPSSQIPEKKGASWAIIGLLSGLLVLVLLGFAGFAGYVYFQQPKENPVIAETSPTPKPSPNSKTSPDASDDEDLKKKVENLEKQLEAQKNQTPKTLPTPFPTQSTTTRQTARANSPNDGFLALRSEPSTASGYRITKIPHGASFVILGCSKSTNQGKIKGRWCQVIYNNQQGWAFDAYMIFN